ncbi:MAG: hypothetical protein QMC77_07865 [Methanocellales archaeon]|nr:hypothetical protein [Methanocellales archaeon]
MNKIRKDIWIKTLVCLVLVGLVIASGCVEKAPKELTITEIIFCSEEPSERDYEIQPDATYRAGDTIWMYVEASEFDSRKLNGEYEVHISLSMDLLDADGNVLKHWPSLHEFHGDKLKRIPDYIWFTEYIYGTDVFESGKYTVSMTFTDRISMQGKTVRGDFYIE